jgi:hypothetical protein
MLAGRAVLVSGGTPEAEEIPDRAVWPIDPGPGESRELVAVLRHLRGEPGHTERRGGLARAWAEARRDPERVGRELAAFAEEVAGRAPALRARLEVERADEAGPLGRLVEEVRWGARDLGLVDVRLGLPSLLAPLAGRPA